MQFARTLSRRITLGLTLALLLIVGVRPLVFRTQADTFPSRRLAVSSSTAGVTANYKFTFTVTSPGQNIGSVRFQICSNTPLIDDACTAPVGFDASAAVLDSQQGNIGFSIDAADSTSNVIVLTRVPIVGSTVSSSYDFSGIINPSSEGTYFARIQTYGSTDATGLNIDYGGLAFAMNSPIAVTATVPPYLLFCNGIFITNFDCNTATGDYVDFGELSTTAARTGQTQMVEATNAGNGVTITVVGSTMTSGNNVINALTANDVSRPGTSQFGLNLRANSDPSVGQNPSGPGSATATSNYNTPNRYRFVSGEQIVSSTGVSDYRKFTVSYIVNVPHGQTPGIYVSSLTYICMASF